MRTPFRITAIACALFLLAASLPAQVLIRVAVGEWPPYLDSSAANKGLAARIMTEAFALQGVKPEFIFVPWVRAQAMLEAGTVEASLLWVRTPERERDFYFSDVVISGTAVFYHLREKPFRWTSFADLSGLRIGGLRSGSYPWFEEAKKTGIPLSMALANTESDNFRLLLLGVIDVFSLDRIVGEDMLRRQFKPEEAARIAFDPKPIENWDYCLMLGRKPAGNQTFVDTFNKGLAKLKASGAWNKIVREYLRAE